MKLPVKEDVEKIDLSKLHKYLKHVPNHFKEGHEPYRLLAYMSKGYKNIADLGTYEGLSALALSNNHLAKVTSYDIDGTNNIVSGRKNITFVVRDLFDHIDDILKCDLIYLDIDPHDGIQEQRFTDILLERKYKGVVIADDIHLPRYDKMIQWWKDITIEKHDVTEIGHHSGTGIIRFI